MKVNIWKKPGTRVQFKQLIDEDGLQDVILNPAIQCKVMNRLMKIIFILILDYSLAACTVISPQKSAPDYVVIYSGFPDMIFFRTTSESFNGKYYFLLHKGSLYIKEHSDSKVNISGWLLVDTFPMAHSDKNAGPISYDAIDQINIDGCKMEIVYKNHLYSCETGLSDYKEWVWDSSWGFPFSKGPGLELPREYRGWSVSHSGPQEQKYQTDGNGNKFVVFVGSIYFLSGDGTIIHIADPWTPADWGYQIATPMRGRFIARNISASGSEVFIISDYGDMFTRHVDFDVIGANPTLRYTYDVIPAHEGIFDRQYPRKLPIAGWKRQPKISGIISDKITVYTTGEGEKARTLRVEGRDRKGNTGYYEKTLNGLSWKFIKVAGAGDIGTLLDDTPEGSDPPVQGEKKDFRYTGSLGGYQAVLDDFNLYCSPSSLRIILKSGTVIQLYLHTVFTFRIHIQRNPGAKGSPLDLKGVIEIPEVLTGSTEPETQAFLYRYLGYSKDSGKSRFIPVDAKATKTLFHLRKAGLFSMFSRLKIDFKR